MTYTQLVDHFGSQSAAARALGLKPPSVCEWQRNGIPAIRQLQLQQITMGKLKAEPGLLEVKAA